MDDTTLLHSLRNHSDPLAIHLSKAVTQSSLVELQTAYSLLPSLQHPLAIDVLFYLAKLSKSETACLQFLEVAQNKNDRIQQRLMVYQWYFSFFTCSSTLLDTLPKETDKLLPEFHAFLSPLLESKDVALKKMAQSCLSDSLDYMMLHTSASDILSRHMTLIESLYAASKSIFLSFKILRLLSLTFISLFKQNESLNPLSEQLEAKKLIDSYINRFEKVYLDISAHETNPESILNQVTSITGETLFNAISVLLTGVRFYSLYPQKQEAYDSLSYYTSFLVRLLKSHAFKYSEHPQLILHLFGLALDASLVTRPTLFEIIYPIHESLNFSSSWLWLYQRSLYYAIHKKDTAEAIMLANLAIKLDPRNPVLWNLLSILMFMRSETEQALKVCDMGFKECSNLVHLKNRLDQKISLMKMTQLDLEIHLYGPKAGLESTQYVFTVLKKLFRKKDRVDSLSMLQSQKNATSSGTSVQTLLSLDSPFYAILFQAYIWIKTSSLYRELKQFKDARSALAEAERLVDFLNIISESKLFKQERSISMSKESSQSQSSHTDEVQALFELNWKKYNSHTRNLVSDIMYERSLVRLEEFGLKLFSNDDTAPVQDEISEKLFDDLIFANSFSYGGHLASQILISKLYENRRLYNQAELWLKRACFEGSNAKFERCRESIFENLKSRSWKELARLMNLTDRPEKARESILNALEKDEDIHLLESLETGLFS